MNGTFRLGDRIIHPDLDRIRGPGGIVEVEPKAMAVLLCLAAHAGEVVSADQLIEEVWQGRPMGDNPVYKCITKLRKALGDNAQDPQFIATVPKKGYRLLREPKPAKAPGVGISRWLVYGVAGMLVLALGLYVATEITGPPQGPAAAKPAVDDASIAVMPLRNLKGDAALPDLGEGLSEEIHTQLGRIDGLSVKSRRASEAVLGRNLTPQQIRGRLRVAFVLEGTVRVIDGRLTWTAQLIDTQTAFDVWAGGDNRDYEDVLDIQHDIAVAVVDALQTILVRDLATPRRSTNSVAAFEAFQRGRSYLLRSLEPEFLQAAQGHFEEALKHDPEYARAHVGLCEVFRRWYRRNGNVLHFDRAEAACRRGAEIDPRLSKVHLGLGQLYRARGRYDHAVESFEEAIRLNANELDPYTALAAVYAAMNRVDEAEILFRQSIERFPRIPAAHARFAVHMFRRGQYKEALALYEKAYNLGATNNSIVTGLGSSFLMIGDIEMAARFFDESLSMKRTPRAHTNLGTTYFFLGRFDDAVEQYRAAIDLAPADYSLWRNLAAGLRQLAGHDAEARNVCEAALELGREELSVNPDDAMVMSGIAGCVAFLGDMDAAREAVARAAELAPHETNVLFNCAVALVDTGDLEAAARMIERAIEQGYPETLVRVNPELRPALGH